VAENAAPVWEAFLEDVCTGTARIGEGGRGAKGATKRMRRMTRRRVGGIFEEVRDMKEYGNGIFILPSASTYWMALGRLRASKRSEGDG